MPQKFLVEVCYAANNFMNITRAPLDDGGMIVGRVECMNERAEWIPMPMFETPEECNLPPFLAVPADENKINFSRGVWGTITGDEDAS